MTSPDDIFQCQKCGDCCRGYGGTYLSPQDIQAIAEYTYTDPTEFTQTYCVFSGNKPMLAQGDDGYCVFWDDLCTIHPVKPRMCKAWPFIESILVDVGNWEAMSALCPGIRTDFSVETIIACVKQKLSENNDRNL
jgi:uncharacterized protein